MDEDQQLDPMSLLSHFSISTIVVSFVFGVIGFYVFIYAKKKTNYRLILTSIALMVYPMFTSGWIMDWSVGLFLCAVAYYLKENADLTG